MKEVVLNGVTFWEYENEKIYSNFFTVWLFCLLNAVLGFITAIIYIISNTVRNVWNIDFIPVYILFFSLLILYPSAMFFKFCNRDKKPSELNSKEIQSYKSAITVVNKISKKKFKMFNGKFPYVRIILSFLSAEIIKIAGIPFFALIGLADNMPRLVDWLQMIGWMVPSSIFFYIALIYLIKNCNLMKAEWQANPPPLAVKAQERIAAKQANANYEKNLAVYKKLTDKCGVKFFIKYYRQISRLPLRDVSVEENYPADELNERLNAAKQIINLNLAEFVLKQILEDYGDILQKEDITAAKSILSEIDSQTADNVNAAAEQILDFVQPGQNNETPSSYTDNFEDK